MNINFNQDRSGFTIIELIIIIAIIAILSAAIYVAIDPARRLNESRNNHRLSDVNQIIYALVNFKNENNGKNFPTVESIKAGEFYQVGTCKSSADSGCGDLVTSSTCIDISGIDSSYIPSIPFDPKSGSSNKTGYYISKDPQNQLIVGVCNPEQEGSGSNSKKPLIELHEANLIQ